MFWTAATHTNTHTFRVVKRNRWFRFRFLPVAAELAIGPFGRYTCMHAARLRGTRTAGQIA